VVSFGLHVLSPPHRGPACGSGGSASGHGIEQMRSIRDGMPDVTRSQRPPRWARYSAKAQASPFAWSGSAPSIRLEVQMRSGRVSRMADATDLRAGAEELSSRHGDAARREMPEEGKHPSALDDHVVPGEANGVEPAAPEGQHVLQRTPRFVYDIHPLTLRCAIHGGRDLAIEGRMDRLSPSVAVARAPTDQVPAHASRRVQVKSPRDGRSGRSRRRSAGPARPSRGSGSGTTASSRPTTRLAGETRRRPGGRARPSRPDRLAWCSTIAFLSTLGPETVGAGCSPERGLVRRPASVSGCCSDISVTGAILRSP
jgi:hypothetical protein